MPEKIYETYNRNADGHTFSFDEQEIKQIASENNYPIYKHYAHKFFREQADTIASGQESRNPISKRELIELFCELYKV